MEITEQIAALVRRGRILSGQIKADQEELKSTLAAIEDLVPVGAKGDVDGVQISRRMGNRSFDWQAAYNSLTPDQKVDCIRQGKALIDEKLVRAQVEKLDTLENFMAVPEGAKAQLKLS